MNILHLKYAVEIAHAGSFYVPSLSLVKVNKGVFLTT